MPEPKLTRKEKEVQLALFYEQERRKCDKDFWYYLTNYVHTLDEHDQSSPFKLFPAKDYLREVSELVEKSSLLALAKSRQIMLTWFFAARATWVSRREGKKFLIISKKENDADAIKDRARVILDGLPFFLRVKYSSSYCLIRFPEHTSEIKALSSDPDAIRMYTASEVLVDEFAFLERPRDILTACLPTVRGGGKLYLISTPNGRNHFYEIVEDAL